MSSIDTFCIGRCIRGMFQSVVLVMSELCFAGCRGTSADQGSRGGRDHGEEAPLRLAGSGHPEIRTHDQWLHRVRAQEHNTVTLSFFL